jgi:exopolysaccharide biosynthesis polyprenyl glycosylphosphotransferase
MLSPWAPGEIRLLRESSQCKASLPSRVSRPDMRTQAAVELPVRPESLAAPEPYLVAVDPPTGPSEPDLAAMGLTSDAPRSVWRSESMRRRMLAAADAAAISTCVLVFSAQSGAAAAAAAAILATGVIVFLVNLTGLYNRDEVRIGHSTLDEIPALAQLTGIATLGVAILHPRLAAGGLGGPRIAELWAALFAGVVAARLLARSLARRVVPVERCLMLGDGGHADRVRARLDASHARAEIVACVSPAEFVLRSPEEIRELVNELAVHRLIVAASGASSENVAGVVRLAKAVGVRVSLLPSILSAIGAAGQFDEVEGLAMLGVPRFGLARSARALKRVFDLVVTSVALAILGPLILMIAAAVKLDSRGPVFFRQVRVGQGGRHFQIIKFRSMVADAEARREELRTLSIAGTGLFKVPEDPRVTAVGNFLRRTSLDELPQLLNVLRGEMSLVGPRPLVVDEDAQVQGLDRSRLRINPGMTGPWQTLASRVALEEMVEIDYLYVSHWSLWLDLKIMLRTVGHVLRRGNL